MYLELCGKNIEIIEDLYEDDDMTTSYTLLKLEKEIKGLKDLKETKCEFYVSSEDSFFPATATFKNEELQVTFEIDGENITRKFECYEEPRIILGSINMEEETEDDAA